MKVKTIIAKPEHEVAYQDLANLLRKNDNVSALEILAIAANMVGKLIALQDQRTVTSEMAMQLIQENIELGNRYIIGRLGAERVGNA